MNMPFNPNAQKYLETLSNKYPADLNGAVEYAYQRGDLTDSEYRVWINRIIEIERQRTNAILKKLAA